MGGPDSSKTLHFVLCPGGMHDALRNTLTSSTFSASRSGRVEVECSDEISIVEAEVELRIQRDKFRKLESGGSEGR
jgi:hypothetical protein